MPVNLDINGLGLSTDYRENVEVGVTLDKSADMFLADIASIDETRWNKSFPYQLAVVRAQQDGGYRIENNWTFTLPIPPEDITITTPFAITTNVTLGGIVEQHNGAPLRMISLSGTTGVFPLRGQGGGLKELNIAEAIFAGTVQAAGQTVNNAIAVLTGAPPTSPNLYDDVLSDSAILPKSTGYYQFNLLKRFLENYVSAMKDPKNRNLRLAFLIWKDQEAYLVTPVQFDARKTKDSPFEVHYTLQFKAWKRINPAQLGRVAATQVGPRTKRDPNLLAQVLNRLQAARDTLQSAQATIQAIKPDFDATVGETMRQTALLIKDTGSFAQTLGEAPASIVKGMRDTVLRQWNAIRDSVKVTDAKMVEAKRQLDAAAKELQNQATKSGAVAKIFDNPNGYAKLFASIKMDALNPPAALVQQINTDKQKVRKLTRSDFEAKRDAVVNFAADYAARVGASAPTYDAQYGRPTLRALRAPQDDDYVILAALSDVAVQLARMATYVDVNPASPVITLVEAIAGFAQSAGIDFAVPASKFAVPVPYRTTLEKLALQYLKDPARWMEIAALNGLRAPYIDEEGFDLDLLTNAVGTTVAVQDVANLWLGQTVWLYSNAVGQTKRHVVNIQKTGSYWTVLLDGDADLTAYTVAAGSKLHGYRPGTTNSRQLIYIPSDRVVDDPGQQKSIAGVTDFDHMLDIGGVDILLTPTNDLAVTPDGDTRLAYGLANLTQYVKIVVGTPKESLVLHRDFGFAVPVGASNADFTAKDILSAAKLMFGNDPAFTGVTGLSVIKTGPTTSLTMAVGIRGADVEIPISVEIAR